MDISLELGPGIRLVAPSRSRKCCSSIQPRRATISWRIMAIWAAGPPNAVAPMRRNIAPTSATVCHTAGWWDGSGVGMEESGITAASQLLDAAARCRLTDIEVRSQPGLFGVSEGHRLHKRFDGAVFDERHRAAAETAAGHARAITAG